MKQLVARQATTTQVRQFVNSFSATNYFPGCSIEIIPESRLGAFVIKVTPDKLGNVSLVPFMHRDLINPDSGYVEGGLIFNIEEVAEK